MHESRRGLLGLISLFALWTGTLPAQQKAGSTAAPRTPAGTARAVPATPQAPVLDGRLDDPAWALATPITDFVQRDPVEGAAPSERTEVRFVYTDAALYVSVRAYDSQPDAIVGRLTRRDEFSESDWIFVAIDSYMDRRTAFLFGVNAAGVKRDVLLFDDDNEDVSWDAVWDVAVARDEHGWTAEFRIPFSQLRFAPAESHRFGLNVERRITRLNEVVQWRLLSRQESGVVSRFGDLTGIQGIRPPRRLEVLPYTVARQAFTPAQDGNPFATGRSSSATVGGDIVYGVTSNLTLNATVNPDFGQVEADPAVVNLSAFETFFPERRPFFNEGLDLFRFPLGVGDGDGMSEQLFYTRRIGRAPQGAADPRGGYAERVNQSTILGAAKLTGKTPGGWSVGLLSAVTAEERARVLDEDGLPHIDVVEPQTTYLVGRLSRDFRGGHTVVGAFGTGTLRNLPDNMQFLRSSAITGGANFLHRFRHDTYHVRAWVAGSHVSGSEDAIARTQRSSARYFHRPDATHVTYDPTRTSLDGWAAQLELAKRGGGNWRGAVGIDTKSPGFEINDLGFLPQVDRTMQWVWVQHRWMQPGKVFRRFTLNGNQWAVWNHAWDRNNVGGNFNAHALLRNYWNVSAGVNGNWGGLSTGALRGGPAIIVPPSINGWGFVGTDGRKSMSFGLNGWFWKQEAEATGSHGVSVSAAWRPAGNVDFRLAPSISWNRNDWQYVRSQDALSETQYIFGDLKQTTVATTLRSNVTFTPTLSLQLYAQPFISAGEYLEFKRVADPRAPEYRDRFDVFGEDRMTRDGNTVMVDLNRDGTTDLTFGAPDFRFLSFRSNAVLRWEYRPGSTLFVVWQHGRSDFTPEGHFDLGGGLGQLFRAPSENMLVVKVNYWLSL